MRSPATTGAAIVAALAVVLTGCGSKTKAVSPSSSSTETTSAAVAPRGTDPTIADYITNGNLTETGVKVGDPNAPVVKLPVPDGWRVVSPKELPDYAYGAVVYSGPGFTNDPPSIVAVLSKLGGNVDPQKIIELAPGELNDLPGYHPVNKGEKSTLGNHPAYVLGGTYTRDGKTRLIAQKTVVISTRDGLYVLQLNIDGPSQAADVIGTATNDMDTGTTIS